MTLYKYSFFMKLLYRYANIPITLVLIIYLIESLVQIPGHWFAVFFAFVNLVLIYALNKYYLKTYRFFPFKIYINNEKMVCENFMMSKKKIEIKHSEIKKINGGIFSGLPTRPIYLYDSKGNLLVGFYTHNEKYRTLLKTILKNVSEELYQELLAKMSQYVK